MVEGRGGWDGVGDVAHVPGIPALCQREDSSQSIRQWPAATAVPREQFQGFLAADEQG